MARERIETGEAPQILLDDCDGDLVVRGWSEPAMLVKGEFEVNETEKGYRLSGQGDLRLYVPVDATVLAAEVAGDAIFKQVVGEAAIDRVHGDLVVTGAGSLKVTAIHGDLVVRSATGALVIDDVHGDVSARNCGGISLRAVYGDFVGRRINGPIAIEEASGDVDLRAVAGDVTIGHAHRDVNLALAGAAVALAQVDGDIRLRGGLTEGDHVLNAQRDIVVRWPAEMPVNLVASGKQLVNRLSLAEIIEKNGGLSGRIGDGHTNLTLTAGGRVILKEADMVKEKWDNDESGSADFDFDFSMGEFGLGNIAARIESEINNHLGRVTRDIESRFGPQFGEQIAAKVSRQAERAAERAERARRKSETRGRFGGFDFAQTAPAPARKPATTEEQLKILKMVEMGTISPEEAGMLLEALES